MKLYRNMNERVLTDFKEPAEYISRWKDSGHIWLSGTKTEGAERETELFLKIEEEDVLALFYALLERYEEFLSTEETCGQLMSNDHRVTPLLAVCAEAMARLGAACRKSAAETRTLETKQAEIRLLTLGSLASISSEEQNKDRLRKIEQIVWAEAETEAKAAKL
jgi:hypothetical protein